jgi:hypothetical protein
MYQELELGDFDPVRKPIEAYLSGVRNYETNRYELSPTERAAVSERWGHVSRTYGYASPAD